MLRQQTRASLSARGRTLRTQEVKVIVYIVAPKRVKMQYPLQNIFLYAGLLFYSSANVT